MKKLRTQVEANEYIYYALRQEGMLQPMVESMGMEFLHADSILKRTQSLSKHRTTEAYDQSHISSAQTSVLQVDSSRTDLVSSTPDSESILDRVR